MELWNLDAAQDFHHLRENDGSWKRRGRSKVVDTLRCNSSALGARAIEGTHEGGPSPLRGRPHSRSRFPPLRPNSSPRPALGTQRPPTPSPNGSPATGAPAREPWPRPSPPPHPSGSLQPRPRAPAAAARPRRPEAWTSTHHRRRGLLVATGLRVGQAAAGRGHAAAAKQAEDKQAGHDASGEAKRDEADGTARARRGEATRGEARRRSTGRREF